MAANRTFRKVIDLADDVRSAGRGKVDLPVALAQVG